MPETVVTPEATVGAGDAPITPPAPRRPSGHRGADVRDTVAEMAARAQEISMEAGSKIAAAMKDVINAAAGVTGFATESARDLVQYMIRRGQMTQDEGEKLLREAEEANSKRPASSRVAPRTEPTRTTEAASRIAPAAHAPPTSTQPSMARKPAAAIAARQTHKPSPAAKSKQVSRKAPKPMTKKPTAKKPAPKAHGRPASKATGRAKPIARRPKPKPKASAAKKKKR